MCWEDVQIGRDTAGSTKMVRVADTTVGLLASANPRRTAITFINGSAGILYVAPQGITPALDYGYQVIRGGTPYTFTQAEHGPIVIGEWSGYSFSDNSDVLVIEAELRLEK